MLTTVAPVGSNIDGTVAPIERKHLSRSHTTSLLSNLAHHVVRVFLRMAAFGRSRHKRYLGGPPPAFDGVALYLAAKRPLDRARKRSRPSGSRSLRQEHRRHTLGALP